MSIVDESRDAMEKPISSFFLMTMREPVSIQVTECMTKTNDANCNLTNDAFPFRSVSILTKAARRNASAGKVQNGAVSRVARALWCSEAKPKT
jgi:hypothetical protein